MLIDQGSAMFSRTLKRPLRYRWISLPQITEMEVIGRMDEPPKSVRSRGGGRAFNHT
jgi:hypothetical protein